MSAASTSIEESNWVDIETFVKAKVASAILSRRRNAIGMGRCVMIVFARVISCCTAIRVASMTGVFQVSGHTNAASVKRAIALRSCVSSSDCLKSSRRRCGRCPCEAIPATRSIMPSPRFINSLSESLLAAVNAASAAISWLRVVRSCPMGWRVK